MADIYSQRFWRLLADLDTSLDPAGPDSLHELAQRYLSREPHVLDVGCRDASHLVRLIAGGGTGVGIDPVPWHVERAREHVASAGLGDRVEIVEGVAEQVPAADDAFDLVWCRDVLEVLPDLDPAVAEMARVLRPGGHLVAFTNVLDGPPDATETATLHEPLGNVVDNLVEDHLVRAFADHGLEVVERLEVGTEWREHLEETQSTVSRDLLRLSRLRRQRDRFVAEYGEHAFVTAQASLRWTALHFLGRLVPVVYVLRPAGGTRRPAAPPAR